MFKFLWNYFKGYVIIKVTGFSIERFLNLCLNKNINLSKIKESKDGIVCRVNIKDFKYLKNISRKTGCKIKIVLKYGMPFFIFKNRKRKMFLVGSIFFVFLLYYFSSFVWNITVTGNDFLDNNQILNFCKEKGIYLGAYKHKINIKSIQTELKNNFDTISWANISIDGTKVTIKISENIPKENTTQTNVPCDIIAKETGIITDIVTRQGTPLVTNKSVVKKDDILVSSEIVLKEGEDIKGTYYTSADADIKAKVEKEITIKVPYEYYTKEYTNNKKTTYNLLAFNKNFNLSPFSKIKYKNYDIITSRKQLKLSNNFYLPFIIKKTQYKEYIHKKKIYSVDEAKLYSNRLLTEKINKEIDFSSDIIKKEIIYNETKEMLIATIKLTIIQDIGKKSPITISNENERNNAENGTSETTNTQ